MLGPSQLPYVVAGVVLMTLQPILVTLSQTEDGRIEYSPVSSTLLSETCKIGISLVLHATSVDRPRTRFRPREVLEFSVPAFIYFVNNNLVFFILSHVDATTFQLLSQMKTLFTGLLFRFFLRRELTAHQYLAIWMLTCGTAVSQLPSSSGAASVGRGGVQPRSSALGLLGSTLSCFLSALGGVYNEKLMKGKPKESIHLQNIQLYSWGVAFNFLGVLLKSPDALSHRKHDDREHLCWLQLLGRCRRRQQCSEWPRNLRNPETCRQHCASLRARDRHALDNGCFRSVLRSGALAATDHSHRHRRCLCGSV
eukprot:TRINITY_DN9202_c0_g1_i1.p1 TRINITY_DN9202_c0_g1~~TRINITY_DN9202_c0_g1_i1.p1  ORF type:complete len:310 (+),score=28.65 TRINITY_DN9202_c0_g1_i1:88-1017(+)